MKTFKILGIGILVILTLLILFAFWYKWKFSMDKTESFEINTIELNDKVLIASQGSDFKMNLVATLIDSLKNKDLYIKVIDVTDLKNEDENLWNAIVIIHTWEYSEPQADAAAFIDKVIEPNKLIVVATSGSGDYKIQGIDGISSASKLSEISEVSEYVLSKIEERLKKIAAL